MMIRKNMGATYDSAAKIAERKSIWMVEYLRSRRHRDGMSGFFRRKYFEELST